MEKVDPLQGCVGREGNWSFGKKDPGELGKISLFKEK